MLLCHLYVCIYKPLSECSATDKLSHIIPYCVSFDVVCGHVNVFAWR